MPRSTNLRKIGVPLAVIALLFGLCMVALQALHWAPFQIASSTDQPVDSGTDRNTVSIPPSSDGFVRDEQAEAGVEDGEPRTTSQDLSDSEVSVVSTKEQDVSKTAPLPDTDAPPSPEHEQEGSLVPEDVQDETVDVPASLLVEERQQIERELAEAEGYSREDLLAMYGRSSAATGRFNLAAASYSMFLEEFGDEHPYSERAANQLAECLAPLDLNSINIIHTSGGPEFLATYRMGYEPPNSHLLAAIEAYRSLVDITKDPLVKSKSLFQIGWIYRALANWDESTRAWDQCSEMSSSTRLASQALWLASENLQWQSDPIGAARRMRRLASEFPESTRAASAQVRQSVLEAEGRRGQEWHTDAAEALRAEVDDRRAVRQPWEVYQEVHTWLNRIGMNAPRVEIARWAVQQSDWPNSARLAAHADLVAALLNPSNVDKAAKPEAVDVLIAQLQLVGEDTGWLISCALRLSVLLRELGRPAEAVAMWERVQSRLAASPARGGQARPERVHVLLAVGNLKAAESLLEAIIRDEPNHPEAEALRALVYDAKQEDLR